MAVVPELALILPLFAAQRDKKDWNAKQILRYRHYTSLMNKCSYVTILILIQVVIRVRPPLPRELSGEIPFKNTVAVDEREQQITISENIDEVFDEDGQLKSNPGPFSTHSFMFDHVYDQNATQKSVFDTTARTVVESALQGYNATIFACSSNSFEIDNIYILS